MERRKRIWKVDNSRNKSLTGLREFLGFRLGTLFFILALCAAGFVLMGCSSGSTQNIPLIEYTAVQQAQAARELKAARSVYPMISRFVDDYGKLRKGIRKAGLDE